MPLTTCPECQSPMKVVTRGEVFVDICPSCRGVWLDGGELERILADTRRHEAERLDNERVADGRPATPQGEGRPERAPTGRKKRRSWFEGLGDLLDDVFD